MFMTAAINK